MREDLLIGEFSELTGISKRMIRHFDAMGLLAPHRIDQETGYRFYSAGQLQSATKIRYLQEFGFSLKEIHELLSNPPDAETFLEILKDQELKLRQESDLKIGQLLKLKKLIDCVLQKPIGLEALPLDTVKRSLQMDIYLSLKEEMKALPSATLLNEHIEDHYKSLDGIPVAFVAFDIDSFLKVNDSFGYDVGDKVIYRFYGIIRDSFKDLMILDGRNRLSRLGGDEFGLFVVGVDKATLLTAVESVLANTRSHDFTQEGCNMPLTSSCGICLATKISHPHDLVHQSGKALIAAKRNGRDQYLLHEQE